VASRVRPDALERPPWERSVLDDIAARRPWNLRVKWARAVARPRLGRLADGVTVIVVTWNTREITADVLRRVQELSPAQTRMLVVDNGSSDGTREMLAGWPGLDTLLLPSNAGHGVALDLAVCAVRTTVAMTLDSDALPLRRAWLDPAVVPVRDGRAVLAGLRASRGFVHPVYSAVDTAAFVRRGLSYQAYVPPGVDGADARWGVDAWDTGELLTGRLRDDEVVLVDPTPNLVDGLPGMTTGGVVYHHGGVSRAADGAPTDEVLVRWRDTVQRLRDAVEGEATTGSSA
jgi:glycosyltransferase involved in cell wall biosynthesis